MKERSSYDFGPGTRRVHVLVWALPWHGRALVGSFDPRVQKLYLADRGEIDQRGNVRL